MGRGGEEDVTLAPVAFLTARRLLAGSGSVGLSTCSCTGGQNNAFSSPADDPEGAFVPPEFDLTGNTFEVSAAATPGPRAPCCLWGYLATVATSVGSGMAPECTL